MRQFILENQIINNNLITLEGKDFRYLRQVLRCKVGDMINVRHQNGNLLETTVAKIDEKAHVVILQVCSDISQIEFQGTDFSSNPLNQKCEFFLFQFLPRPQKFELIVRQATECGIATIIPVLGEYSEESSATILQGNKKERIEKIIREARQQSGSPVQTKVLPPFSLKQACEFWQNEISGLQNEEKSLALVLSERKEKENSIANILKRTASDVSFIKKAALAVGSEGGISPAEVEILQKEHFEPIHFDVNILRCETAALYGIAAVQSAIL